MRLLFLLAVTPAILAQAQVGPAKGFVIAGGGGGLDLAIWRKFVGLAGGPEAPVIVIPTADEQGSAAAETASLRDAGAQNITVLHTRDRKVADSEKFVEPLKRAGGVWFGGGRQWHLVDSYLNTRTLSELRAVLARGGVIGGSSAGASILGSYLVRGSREDNQIMMAPGYEQGFGFLCGVAIDQHLLTRQRESDMVAVIAAHPQLLGIGIDEHTAVFVQGDWLEVAGPSKVAIYESGKPYFFLGAGARFNMRTRSRPASAIRPGPTALELTLAVAAGLAGWWVLSRSLKKYRAG